MKRDLKIYIPIMVFIVLIGLPARVFQEHLPYWYTQYFGDFLWAMLIYFLYAIIFGLKVRYALFVALFAAYTIEISQLFKPDWLEYLRSFRICRFILGYGFLWSDLIAYTLGISLGAIIDNTTSKFLVSINEK